MGKEKSGSEGYTREEYDARRIEWVTFMSSVGGGRGQPRTPSPFFGVGEGFCRRFDRNLFGLLFGGGRRAP